MGVSMVLDGELVARQGRLDDFYAVAAALASRSQRGPAVTFAAFDILWLEGDLLVNRAYEERRKLLLGLPLEVEGRQRRPLMAGRGHRRPPRRLRTRRRRRRRAEAARLEIPCGREVV